MKAGSAKRKAVAPESETSFSLISNQKLIAIYTAMVKLRMTAETAARLSRKGLLTGEMHRAVGREAALAGVCADLTAEDAVSVADADAAVTLMKGLPLHELLGQHAAKSGKKKSKSRKKPAKASGHVQAGSGVLPRTPSAAARLAMACGVAQEQKWRAEGKVTAAICGDEELSLEAWIEPLRLAGKHRLPMVFVCHNEPSGDEAFEQIAAEAKRCGIPPITVDGWDAVAVYRVAFESIARARQGRGATLIECRTDAQPQTAKNRRNARTRAQEHDPLRNMEAYLKSKRIGDEKLRLRIARAFRRELGEATKSLGV